MMYEMEMYHVRMINKNDEYYPNHLGWVVKVTPSSQFEKTWDKAKAKIAAFFDNGPEGEFAGWELTAQLIEFQDDVAEL